MIDVIRNAGTGLRQFLPRGKAAIIGLAAIAIIAFALGGMLSGGSEDSATGTAHNPDEGAAATPAPTIWTCAMHPQIKLPKPGKCPICFMDLIPLDSGSDEDLGPRELRMSQTAKELARIQTTPAVRDFAQAEVRMVGKIVYDETRVAYITAWVPGRLDRLFADYTGVSVKKGDHLVHIYSPELVAAQEELIQAHRAIVALENASSPALRSTAEATRVAAREKLRLWGLTMEQIDHIETTHETSDHLTIYSPIGGVVVHKDALEGMYVSTGTRIYTIADLDKLWVMLEAYESDLPWLRFGQRVRFTSPSFPGEHFDAVISFIDPLVNPKTRTVRIRAVVDNSDRRLKPDMFVRGLVNSRIDVAGNIIDEYLADKWLSPMHPEVVKDRPGKCDVCGMDLVPASSLGFVSTKQGSEHAPLLIPASAPLITGERAVVYVELPTDGAPLFEGREILLGPRAGDFYVVKSGIEEGDLVVSNGAFKIDSELQIQAKPSMMSPTGEGAAAGHQHGGAMPASGSSKEVEMSERFEETAEVVKELTPVYTSYFEVQMALARDDLDAARKAGAGVSTAVKNADMSAFSRDGHFRWMDLSKDIAEQGLRISNSKDLKAARDGFFHLSVAALELHRSFGHAGTKDYYMAHCPMARQGDGAYWLQADDTVWNSFYGESMLRCGSTEKIASTGEGRGKE